jgi:iron(III) transport system substrate-binding protein
VKDFAAPAFKGKGVMSKPLTGTTLTHVCALYAANGKDATDAWIESLLANDILWAPGNGPAMREVAEGGRPFCLTDTDDAYGAELQKYSVKSVYPDQGADDPGLVLIPNTVMLIKGAKHPVEAKAFIDYLLSNEVEEALAKGRSAQIPLHPGVPRPAHVKAAADLKVMPVDWAVVGSMIENHFDRLEKKFAAAPSPSAPGSAPAAQSRTATWVLLGILALAIVLLIVRSIGARRGAAAG